MGFPNPFAPVLSVLSYGATALTTWFLPWLLANAGAPRAIGWRPPPQKQKPAAEEDRWDAHGLAAGGEPVPPSRLDARKRYKVSEVGFLDRRAGGAAGAEKDDDPLLGKAARLRAGGVYTRSQLLAVLKAMAGSGSFDDVDVAASPKPDGTLGVTVSFAERVLGDAGMFRCVNVGHLSPPALRYNNNDDDGEVTDAEEMACILPEAVREEVQGMVNAQQGKVTARLLRRINDRVQKWYHDEGFVCAQVVSFRNPRDTGEVACEVVEGDITKVEYRFLDKLGNVVDGNTNIIVIDRELPPQLRPGQIYNSGAGKQALNYISSLGLFSNVELNPRPDETEDGGVVVEVKLSELEPKSAELSTNWSIAPWSKGIPALASFCPGGTMSLEHRNIAGLNRSLVGSVASGNLLNPLDDLSFKFEYVHPYLDGVENRSRNRTFKASCFNTRKLSPTFVAGPSMAETPPIWIDRRGFKANITENFTRQSTFTYGLVVEEITALDERNNICTHGSRVLPSGALSMDGPPTTFSGTGVDQMAFLQGNITRDTTAFVNGTPIGDRIIVQCDQGLGIGSNNPVFNRHQLSVTKFINLNKQEQGAGLPPPAVLALHGRYAGCIGDLPAYDAFALGGPHSVRGYNMGELGAARSVVEGAVELSVPITIKNTHAQAYAFAEHGNDLGSSKDVKGNPTEFFRRAGHGTSFGFGVKIGPIRAEFTVDLNAFKGSFSLRFGERF